MDKINLDSLAIEYNTDKSSLYHNYTKIYSNLYDNIRDSVKGVLELGVGNLGNSDTGASLKMFRDYFTNATIVGVDIDNRANIDLGDRVHIVIGDQTRKSVLDKALSYLDDVNLIIDDASHINRFTIATFEYLFKFLNPGGIYIIEDTQCSGSTVRFQNNTRYEMEQFILMLLRSIEFNGRIISSKSYASQKKINNDFVMNYYEKYIEYIQIYYGCYIIKKRDMN